MIKSIRTIFSIFFISVIFSSCANSDFIFLEDTTFTVNGSNISYNNCSVGINTSAPEECLHVEGNALVTERMYLSNVSWIEVTRQ